MMSSESLRCVGMLLLISGAAPVVGADRPNVVILLADDLGYGELGCYGGTEIPTPNIDSLARDGVRLTSGYVTAPYCAASRAGLLTGRYQTRFGFEFNPIGATNDDPQIGLPVEERTIADKLRDAGYATALVGKWHLGATAAYHPQRRGFDEFYGFLHEGHYFVPPPWNGTTTWLRRNALPDGSQGRWTSPDGRIIWSTHMGHREPDYDANNPILRNSQPVAESRHLTDAITQEAVNFIDRHQSQPFFLLAAYNAVHSPLQGAGAYMERFGHIEDIQRRIFAAMLAHLDDGVGDVLDALKAHGLDEQTIVVFLSDNGGPTRELTSSNRPLRGEKGQLYEGGMRVPFVIRWPGTVPPGGTDDRMMSSLDLNATIRAAAVLGEDDRLAADGVDLAPYLSGALSSPPRDVLYWRMGTGAALRQGQWKIVRPGRRGGGAARWQLYDLAADLGETEDLAERDPERLSDMVEVWSRLNEQMIEPRW